MLYCDFRWQTMASSQVFSKARSATATVLFCLLFLLPGPGASDTFDATTNACFGEDRGRRIEACSALLEGTLSDRERSLAHAMRALSHSVRGNYTKALPDYDAAIELRSDFAVALNNRAWAHYKLGNIDQGFVDVTRALALSPRSAHALDTRAHLRQAEGNAVGAIQDYRAAMRYGGAGMVQLYQCGLQSAGYYLGPLTGIYTDDLLAALTTCVKGTGCDPLPADEECRRPIS